MCAKPITLILLLSACALSGFGQASPKASETSQEHLRKAQQYLAEKQPQLAIPELEAAVALDPTNLDAQANLGVLLFFKGEYAKAVPHLRAAVKEKPDLWKIQALLGLSEYRLKDSSGARTDLEAALPHLQGKIQMEVGHTLVENYTATGELAKAAAAVSTMLKAQPTNASLLDTAYRLYSNVANRAMLTLAMVAPQSAEMYQVMAIKLGRRGDQTGAIAYYRKALQIDPKLPGLHLQFGNLLFNSTDPKLKAEAESQFRAALAVNPQDEKAQLMLGKIAARGGHLKAAYAAFTRAVKMQPNDADACTELAKILVTMNEPEKARALLDQAVNADPTNLAALYRLSALDRQQGRTEEANRELARFKHYRQLKDNLRKVFHDVPLELETKATDEDAMGK